MEDEQERLFSTGLEAFNNREFYAAHEFWEDLWSDYKLDDALFIQGLIQVAVGCFHLTNLNVNGAVGLFTKCLPKLEKFTVNGRDLAVSNLIAFVREALEQLKALDDTSQFNWKQLPQLEYIRNTKGRDGTGIKD